MLLHHGVSDVPIITSQAMDGHPHGYMHFACRTCFRLC
jgi:hypothetical protein